MVKAICKSPVKTEKTYRYSGLIFLLMPEIIERITGEDFETYLYENIYNLIGAKGLTYNPLSKYSIEEIIPTELDTFFRNQLIHGRVHDEAAAMLEGVSCNAGLFGKAEDLAKLFQLYLNNGNWNGKQIIASESVHEFTKCQYCETENRRGLGFDKPPIEYEWGQSYVAESASPESFGHSGFTGTFVWADPKEDLILIFLSNRVHPTRENRKLYSLDIRPSLHQAIYDSIK
jgi:CubicO group peptidase (beta-lactamase class C family)